MRDQDRQFFDTFMLVLGILIGVSVGLFFLVRMISIDTAGQFRLEDPLVQEQIEERIAPVGQVVLLGSDELAAAAAVAEPAPAPVEAPMSGPQVFNDACYLCHSDPGVGGAPVVGDVAAWSERVDKGMETLTDHALNGFQGDAGFMPAKGGRMDLTEEEVVRAVEYMVEQVEGSAGGEDGGASGEDGGASGDSDAEE